MKTTILALTLLALAAPASAQVDGDPDGIGIYFDQAATLVTADFAETDFEVQAYLVLTHPSLTGVLTGWSAYVGANPDDTATASVFGVPAAGENLAVTIPGDTALLFEVSVDPAAAYPVDGTTVLAHLTLQPWTADAPIPLFVWTPGGYAVDGEEATAMHPSSGDPDAPVAVINGAAPVPGVPTSWGDVRALYR